MDESWRNREIAELLDIWEWCSRLLHVKWRRRLKRRNAVLMALGYVVLEPKTISPFELSKNYKTLPPPLLDKKKVLSFWKVQPLPLLELCLGSFTKKSPLKEALDQIRISEQNNVSLDNVAKKMRAREKRFGSEWCLEGHHPQEDYRALKRGTTALRAKIRAILSKNHSEINGLAYEVLSQGGWQFGQLPAASFVRKTPESLLNRSSRLRLWRAAQEVVARNLEEDQQLEMLCEVLNKKMTPSLRSAIEAQGYSVDQVIDDMLNFDMYKSRSEIA
jgi:hypothetical protein